MTDKRQEHIWTLSSEHMTGQSIKTLQAFLAMASNAHTIDIHMRADGRDYKFQADVLKYMKWVPIYKNDVTGEMEDIAYSHLAKSIANNAEKAKKLDEILLKPGEMQAVDCGNMPIHKVIPVKRIGMSVIEDPATWNSHVSKLEHEITVLQTCLINNKSRIGRAINAIREIIDNGKYEYNQPTKGLENTINILEGK